MRAHTMTAVEFPEPPNGARLEWRDDDHRWGAYREDALTGDGDWFVYGDDGRVYSWRRLVARFHLTPETVTYLTEAASAACSEAMEALGIFACRDTMDGAHRCVQAAHPASRDHRCSCGATFVLNQPAEVDFSHRPEPADPRFCSRCGRMITNSNGVTASGVGPCEEPDETDYLMRSPANARRLREAVGSLGGRSAAGLTDAPEFHED